MGFALVLVGLLMVVTGSRGTYAQFGTQIASEFSGTNNFAYWLGALGAVGALGYIKELQLISRLLMTLILLSLFLTHKGFFAQFQSALTAGPKAPNTPAGGSTGVASAAASGSSTLGTLTNTYLTQPFENLFGAGSNSTQSGTGTGASNPPVVGITLPAN